MRLTLILMGIVAAGTAIAQQNPAPQAGTRQLPYFKVAQKDPLPPIRKETAAPRAAQGASRTTEKVSPQAVMNLGFRYTLLLVKDGRPVQAVDSERNFRAGDCVALQMESSHSGYLYVLAKQSSGSWQPMLPSPHAPEETNVIDPGQKVRVPSNYCFEITDPPGAEILTVILSRDPRDIFDLHQAIREDESSRRPAAPTELASARIVNREVERMSKQFGTRDLVFRKTEKPVSGDDTQYSVSVLNGTYKPASLVVTQVTIKHQ